MFIFTQRKLSAKIYQIIYKCRTSEDYPGASTILPIKTGHQIGKCVHIWKKQLFQLFRCNSTK